MPYTKWKTEFTYCTFGIENEFNAGDCSFYSLDAVAHVNNVFRAEGLEWMKVIRDGSSNVDVEIVTPPAVDCPEFWEDYSKVMQVCADMGLKYVGGCGLHVHIGNRRTAPAVNAANFWKISKERAIAGDFTPNENLMSPPETVMSFELVKDIVRFYALNQNKICAAMPASRAHPDGRSMITEIGRLLNYDSFKQAQTIPEIITSMTQGLAGWATSPKFNAVNLCTWESIGTIEFRQHPATLSTGKIKNWVELLTTAIDTCDSYRLPLMNDEEETEIVQTVTTPEAPYRRHSNMDIIWRACRIEGGATVRQLINLTGWDADTIRPRISEMRSAHGQDAILTHTQQSYNHRYGSSEGRHDLGGYEILREYERTITAAETRSEPPSDAPVSIFHNVPHHIQQYFTQGPVTRIRLN